MTRRGETSAYILDRDEECSRIDQASIAWHCPTPRRMVATDSVEPFSIVTSDPNPISMNGLARTRATFCGMGTRGMRPSDFT